MDLIMVTQYFDTIKDIGSHAGQNTLFLPHSPGAVESVNEQIARTFSQVKGTPVKREHDDAGRQKLLLPSEKRKLAGITEEESFSKRKTKSKGKSKEKESGGAKKDI